MGENRCTVQVDYNVSLGPHTPHPVHSAIKLSSQSPGSLSFFPRDTCDENLKKRENACIFRRESGLDEEQEKKKKAAVL
jgi:hypothetical protein